MSTLDYAGLSEKGPVRDNNEDFIASELPDDLAVRSQKGALFIIADGVGGHRAGEVASGEATRKLVEEYYASAKKPLLALQHAFRQANRHVYDMGLANPAYDGMATTLSAITLIGSQAYIGHVGDTRIYRLRDGSLHQLTRDHSEVGELVRMQILTPEEAQRHHRRHVITRSIGDDLMTRIDYHSELVRAGDSFVLCTDGLWEPLAAREIAEIVWGSTAQAATRQLVARALDRSATDNVSVQVVKVVALTDDGEQPSPRKDGLLRRTLNLISGALA